MFGETFVVAQAAITRGALVAIQGTTGKVVAITIGVTTASDRLVGQALEAAAADGDLIPCFIGRSNFVVV